MKNIVLIVLSSLLLLHVHAQSTGIFMQIDGAKKYQQLDGFGVNINTAWWYDGVYTSTMLMQPAIDLLADSLGATLFRAVIEEIDWEVVNDDNDPDHFNMSYYNKVFSSQKFQGIWETLRYLNRKGITDGLLISFMGSPPAAAPLDAKDQEKSWMGGTDYSIDPSMEDEFAETIAAFLYYARFTEKIQFILVSPINETDVISMSRSAEHPDGIVEGPNIPDAAQFVRITKKLANKLDAIGMGDIRFVVADAAGDKLFTSFLTEMVKDKYLLDKLAHWGVHQYGSSAGNYRKIVSNPANPNKSLWVTEMAGIGNMLGQLSDSAHACIFWDGFDCVYQHARRNGYGSIPPNDWVFWYGPDEGKPLIEYLPATNSWTPRKQFFHFAHIFKFVKPGAVRIGSTGTDSSLVVQSFLNPNGQLVIAGRYTGKDSISLHGTLTNLPAIDRLSLFCTTADTNLQSCKDQMVVNHSLEMRLPPDCIFTLAGQPESTHSPVSSIRPEPADWFAGDMHVHRNCGDVTGILDESEFTAMMEPHDLAVISVLADMGNGEVKDSRTDLPKVTGKDAVQSLPGRIVHWDAEWHFDPAGVTFKHKALGGHIVLLGLTDAHTFWDESTYNILAWGKAQQAVVGFCHMQYLHDSMPDALDCCTPLDFPVEAALGTIDFLAEDVWINDASVNAYYKLLNCGFRLGWAAGTDFPCNNSEPFGTQLTYVQIKDQHFSYDKWITGIRDGRTVVSTNGHEEFIALQVNGKSTPGDEIELAGRGNVPIEAKWTSARELTGSIEIIYNGKVAATLQGTSRPGEPVILRTSVDCSQSSWICARRMDEKGHRLHTAPVYVSVNNAPVRASAEDARYFAKWIYHLLAKTAPGEAWSSFFTNNPDEVRDRYRKARAVYEKIAQEATDLHAK